MYTCKWKCITLALGKFMTWSRARGETKQHELLGMSSGRSEVENPTNLVCERET